jgi:hypothetical protein
LLSVTRSSSAQVSVISFFPDHGKVGDSVTVFGSGFIPNPAQNTVSFNGTPAAVASATATALVAAVPSGATTGPITVTNANGTAASAQAYTVVPPPIITGVTPGFVGRGVTVRMEISGSHLAFTRTVTFSQAGISASILPGATDQLLLANLSVSATVPFGSYSFSVTNDLGSTTESGTVTVTVTATLSGAMSVTRPVSVFLPPSSQVVPSGDSMSVTRPVSVFLPAPPQVAPSGDSISVTRPVSVFLLPSSQVAPSGDSMSVTQPVSVSMP